jgi:hypothetical protein
LDILIESCLNLISFFEVKPFFDIKFEIIWITLIQEEDFKLKICDLYIELLKISNWNLKKAEIEEFFDKFGGFIMKSFSDVKNYENTYEFHKKLAIMITEFGLNPLKAFNKDDQKILSKYYTVLLKVASHPSLKIFSEISNLIIKSFEKDTKYTLLISEV